MCTFVDNSGGGKRPAVARTYTVKVSPQQGSGFSATETFSVVSAQVTPTLIPRGAFTVFDKPPEVSIFTEGGEYESLEIGLEAFVYDPEDGILPDEQVVGLRAGTECSGTATGCLPASPRAPTFSPFRQPLVPEYRERDNRGYRAWHSAEPAGAPGPGPVLVVMGLPAAGICIILKTAAAV
jgi:hypothetical protein